MSGDDELREAIAQALADSDASAHGAYTWGECGGELRGDYRRYADAVLALPELEAWVERRARERAAEELTTLAFRLLDQGIPDRTYAMTHSVGGIWGGLTEKERGVMRRHVPGATRKRSHCAKGHELTPENVRRDRDGQRCRLCHNAADRASRARRAAS